MKKFLLPLALFCLLLAACGSESPADKLNGTWTLDTDATLDATLKAQGVDPATPAFAQAKEAAKTQMASMLGNMTLTFDTGKKTLSGEMMGQKQDNTPYTVKSEEAKKVVIVNQGTELSIDLNDDGTLTIHAGPAAMVMKKK